MYSNIFLKSFRILLIPFSFLFWIGLVIRNWLYDINILSSVRFGLPVICIGNLSVGGTGKSSLTEYLAEILSKKFKVAIISRGYKRKTKGYILSGHQNTALDIGDEPMQFYRKFPHIPVAVGEQRVEAIPQLLYDKPDTEVILLDDAFQHRAIKPGLNILLTDYENIFTRDFYLPAGDLRDLKRSYKRAEIIIITKCNPDMGIHEKEALIKEIKPVKGQRIYFTTLQYGKPYHILSKKTIELNEYTAILLVTGIANPKPLKKLLEEKFHSYSMIQYPDHHIFTIDDWKEIKTKFEAMEAQEKIVLSTEKDAVRLEKFKNELTEFPFYIIPVRHQFLFNEDVLFQNQVEDFIRNFKK